MELDEELLKAAEKGDVDRVRELLRRGANPNTRGKDGITPLHLAAHHGYVGIARLLLEHGADVNARDKDGYTPLHWTAFYGKYDVARHDVARLLLNRGADVDARDRYDSTPLHLAAFVGSLDVVKLLLECGADVNARDRYGKTPLDMAREWGHMEVARVIKEYGRRAGGVEAAGPGVAGAPSILGVECSSFYAGEWGRLLVRVKGAGLASLVVEGNVEWLDPGRVMLSGESIVEVPVRPGAAGELPVRIVVKSEGGEDVRIAWLKVSEKAKKCPSCGAPAEPGAKYCWKCGAKLE